MDKKTSILSVIKWVDDANGVLSKPCEPVTEVTKEITELIDSMCLTLIASGGLGLSAPQVGKNLRILVLNKKLWEEKDDIVMINPELIVLNDNLQMTWEYCLSFPDMGKIIKRHIEVQLNGYSRDMKNQHVLMGEGLQARVIEHEFDHLEGITLYNKNE